MTLTADAQGTALKTLIAMPFVLDGQHCRVEVTAAGVKMCEFLTPVSPRHL